METGRQLINQPAFIVDGDGRRIPVSISTALLRDAEGRIVGGAETFRDLSLVEELRKELQGRFQMGELVSRSPLMRRIFDILPQVASNDSTVLIQGETGTGKELLARAIHGLSARKERRFIAVNCGSLPDSLLESEMFGYKAGAFTGAVRDKPGRFALAEGGTLLLDEIGEISLALQVRFLRVLQEKSFEPLGATKPVKADVRVLASTNRDLATLTRKGSFRQDLFYRINVVRIELPPLRKRREDIPLLIDYFLKRFNGLHGKNIDEVSPQALALLMAHDYPGNVRELENVIEHAFVLCPEGRLELSHLPEELVSRRRHVPGADINTTIQTVEAQAIRQAIQRHDGNRLAAARELGIHKSTLFRKIKALSLALPKQDGRSRR
jgi:transcriptional regulator with PAS, ATPase and Fis domain